MSFSKEFARGFANQPLIQRRRAEPTSSSVPSSSTHSPSPSTYQETSGVSSASSVHKGLICKKVVDTLKQLDRPLKLQDIGDQIGFDIVNDPEIINALKQNERVKFNEKSQMLEFKPYRNIKVEDDLLKCLKHMDETNEPEGGISTRDLSYDFTSGIKKLETSGQILTVPMSGGHKILYWNRFINQKMVDPDFVKMWHRVTVPDERDLEREFQKAGMKSSSERSKLNGPVSSSLSKRRRANTSRQEKRGFSQDYEPC